MTARLQHITIRDELPRVRELARQRANRDQKRRIWRALKLWVCRAANAAFWVSWAYALWLILGRV